jgi:hypothetical protein
MPSGGPRSQEIRSHVRRNGSREARDRQLSNWNSLRSWLGNGCNGVEGDVYRASFLDDCANVCSSILIFLFV